ncbi:MAG: hypothetical protein MZW92_76125 [Comamonadaceae bacterium]|nr:hypothetical protein [Comamonadaceae bacterium]
MAAQRFAAAYDAAEVPLAWRIGDRASITGNRRAQPVVLSRHRPAPAGRRSARGDHATAGRHCGCCRGARRRACSTCGAPRCGRARAPCSRSSSPISTSAGRPTSAAACRWRRSACAPACAPRWR